MPSSAVVPLYLPSFPTRRSSDLPRSSLIPFVLFTTATIALLFGLCLWAVISTTASFGTTVFGFASAICHATPNLFTTMESRQHRFRSEEHTSELQSLRHLVCRLLLSSPYIFPLSLHDALPIYLDRA